MATLAKLVVELGFQDSAFAKGIDGASANLRKFGSAAREAGQKLTTAVTLPAVAAATYVVKAASDMNEAISATSTVFGKSGDAVLTWSDTTAKTLGIAKSDALTAATQFATLGQAAGLTNAELVPFSTSLVQAASDLSSFWNTPSSQVLDDLRSGLNGQYEPLLKYGIQLSEAAVQQRALADTGKTSVDQLTAGEKAIARYNLIMEGMGPALGDFARTQDGLANSTRIAQAQFKDAAAALGQMLLPYVLQGVQAITDLMTRFQALSPETQKYIMIAIGLAAALGPAIFIIGSLATAIGFLASPIGLVVVAIAGLMLAYQTNFLGFADGVNGAVSAMTPIIQGILPTFEAFKNYISAVVSEGDTLNDWLTHIPEPLQGVALAVGEMVAQVQATLPIAMNALNLFKDVFIAIKPTVVDVMTIVGNLVLQTITSVIQIFTGLVQAIRGAMQVIKGILTGDWSLIKEGVTNIVTGLKTVVLAIFDGLKAQLTAVLSIYKTIFSDTWNAIKDEVIGAVTTAVDGVIGKLTAMKDSVYNAAYNAGYAIGQGVIAGVNAIWNSIMGFLDSLISAIWDKVKQIGDIDIPLPSIPGLSSVSRTSINSGAGMIAPSGLAAVNSGGNTYQINITVPGAGDPRVVADAVFEVFAREMALTTGAL